MREAETQAEGEADSLRGAHAGFHFGTLRSGPELKADAQPLSHPGVPRVKKKKAITILYHTLSLLSYAIQKYL